ncbi:hypothetical protein BDY19DRAFT_995347 [Irpex rosettiformis]|uniref:Uncharacterized protein n=1 Tax=Irpex rosettiformis TaxID=378272 RepID=A0ACB8TYL4_9APHY|nr:hypothetical protein BDY19DRAFT_995347 [Irpex rosettiformis]
MSTGEPHPDARLSASKSHLTTSVVSGADRMLIPSLQSTDAISAVLGSLLTDDMSAFLLASSSLILPVCIYGIGSTEKHNLPSSQNMTDLFSRMSSSTKRLNIPLAFPVSGASWVEWHQWGPPMSATYGTKAISLRSFFGENAEFIVQDFFQGAKRLGKLRRDDTHEARDILSWSSKSEQISTTSQFLRSIFDGDVETFLPYVELEIEIPGSVTSRDQVILSEDLIVILEHSSVIEGIFNCIPSE